MKWITTYIRARFILCIILFFWNSQLQAQFFSYSIGHTSGLVGAKGLNAVVERHADLHPQMDPHFKKMNLLRGPTFAWTILGRHGIFADGQLGVLSRVSTSMGVDSNPKFPPNTEVGYDLRLRQVLGSFTLGLASFNKGTKTAKGILLGVKTEGGFMTVGTRAYNMEQRKTKYTELQASYFIRAGPSIGFVFAPTHNLFLQAQLFLLFSPQKWDSSPTGARMTDGNSTITSNSNHFIGMSFLIGLGKILSK